MNGRLVIVNVDLDWQDDCPILFDNLFRQINSFVLFRMDLLIRQLVKLVTFRAKDYIVSDIEFLGSLSDKLITIERLTLQLQSTVTGLLGILNRRELVFMLTGRVLRRLGGRLAKL